MKRLIETDLPIKQISAHSRREKSIRHGHISTLHIWWARRPLAACRAVVLASLLPDPTDNECPKFFQQKATELINHFAETVNGNLTLFELCNKEHRKLWETTAKKPLRSSVSSVVEYFPLQQTLLQFIADFANWDCSTVPLFLDTARELVAAANTRTDGAVAKPLVADPFAGGGSIPLEALRVGADAFASDLNPVAVLLNKVVLEYIPKYGQKLADAVRKEGERIKSEAEKELAAFYPKDGDGSTPIAYLWARTIQCEGPGCGATVPLLRSLWLAKKDKRKIALEMQPFSPGTAGAGGVSFHIIEHAPKQSGTVVRGNATCPCCGYTTPVAKVREQLKKRKGGANDAQLLAVVTTRTAQQGRFYREATQRDYDIVKKAQKELAARIKKHNGELSLVPDEPTPAGGGSGAGRAFSQRNYGMNQFGDLFTSRQLLSLTTLCRLVREMNVDDGDISVCLDEVEIIRNRIRRKFEICAIPLEKVEFTVENYEKLFGKNKVVETPIGKVKIGENQLAKLEASHRQELLGALLPTLTHPIVIIRENRDAEQALLYVKTFLTPNKEDSDKNSTWLVMSVIVTIRGTSVAVSTHRKDVNNVLNKINNAGDIEYEINITGGTGGNGDKPLAIADDNHLTRVYHNSKNCQDDNKIKDPADILYEKPAGTPTVNSVNSPDSEELHLTSDIVAKPTESVNPSAPKSDFQNAVKTCLALAVDRQADYSSSLCMWASIGEFIAHTFGRQALPITWDFVECCPFPVCSGSYLNNIEWIAGYIENNTTITHPGQAVQSSATHHPLSDGSVDLFFTDPPYYDAVPYADLSDFFIVWLRRSLEWNAVVPTARNTAECAAETAAFLSPKDEECVVDEIKGHDKKYFETTMQTAMTEGRRILSDDGRAVVVFAHKSTSGWEAQLSAMIDAGWIITASWSIDTERPGRLRSQNSAALASSIHLVCRPRTNDTVGEWREVHRALPQRIHAWLPRLAQEGIVGADAIFACIGPALEIFSQYKSVEKANGDTVPLREYLEHVWAVISKEALSAIFKDADANGLEEDARLTCIWLWTLFSPSTAGADEFSPGIIDTGEDADEDDETDSPKPTATGFSLDFDTARKIAQGLGAHLETLDGLVQIKGSMARLFSVEERVQYLFRKTLEDVADITQPIGKQKNKKVKQTETLFDAIGGLPPMPEGDSTPLAFSAGDTVLDRIHQCMLLFGAGRSDAIRRFLVDENYGRGSKFWTLAQTLSALYPVGSTEKRWIDGLLAKKKGLGL